MPTYRAHTMSVRSACSLWRQYGSQVQPEDTEGALFKRLAPSNVPAWKCRVLAHIGRQLKETGLSGEPALIAVFGQAWRDTNPVGEETPIREEVRPNGDISLSVASTIEGVNLPIMNLEELIAVSKTDMNQNEVVTHKVNSWSTVTKSDEGEPRVTRLWQITATFRPRVIPLVAGDWGPPPPYKPRKLHPSPSLRQALVFPDMQIGYRWNGLADGKPWAEPFHDRKAIDIGCQIAAKMQPEKIILIGDNLDFQPLSIRWAVPPESLQTTALSIAEYRWLLWRLRQVCPNTEIIYMFGNHEARLEKYLDDRAGELKGLTLSSGQRMLSLRSILGLDELHIASHDYPKPYWLWDRIEIEHGRTVRRGGGATAARVATENEHSVIYGHIHRQELAHRTVVTPTGKRELVYGSPGCLCRTDGIVPGSDRPDWQQGMGVVSLINGMDEQLDLVRIQNGRAVFGGVLLEGVDYVSELVAATGMHALKKQDI